LFLVEYVRGISHEVGSKLSSYIIHEEDYNEGNKIIDFYSICGATSDVDRLF